MPKSIIVEGKTSNEAIEKGLKELNATKDIVEIKILENKDKRSFFDILAPRVVKVEIKLKENNNVKINNECNIKKEDEQSIVSIVEKFFNQFFEKQNIIDIKKEIKIENGIVKVNISGENISFLIGYRGEVLEALQTLVSTMINKDLRYKNKVIIDVEGYKEKRQKILEELAEKISRTVVRNHKSITLEPMTAYERKIIHTKLQNSNYVRTYSIGEEPYRKIVVALKNK